MFIKKTKTINLKPTEKRFYQFLKISLFYNFNMI